MFLLIPAKPETTKLLQQVSISIEHGYKLTDETIALMVEKGTFYDPTINCNLSEQYIKEIQVRLEKLGYSDDELVVKVRNAATYADERTPEPAMHQRQALKKAADAGVKLLIGANSKPIGERCQRDANSYGCYPQRRRYVRRSGQTWNSRKR